MEGLEAEKKKNDHSLKHNQSHIKVIGAYTTLKGQYSQLNNLIKNGRCKIR
jgi:hypothetical protein